MSAAETWTEPDGGDADAALIDALAAGDHERVVGLYHWCGAREERRGRIDAACFLYTHAFVHALEAADPRQQTLRELLVRHGREA